MQKPYCPSYWPLLRMFVSIWQFEYRYHSDIWIALFIHPTNLFAHFPFEMTNLQFWMVRIRFSNTMGLKLVSHISSIGKMSTSTPICTLQWIGSFSMSVYQLPCQKDRDILCSSHNTRPCIWGNGNPPWNGYNLPEAWQCRCHRPRE